MGDVTTGMRNIIAGMEQQGIRRLVLESALGVTESRPQSGFRVGRVVMPLFLKELFAQKGHQEAAIKASGLEWVNVHPFRLINLPFKQRAAILTKTAGMSAKSSRAEVASLMLEQRTDQSHLRQVIAPG